MEKEQLPRTGGQRGARVVNTRYKPGGATAASEKRAGGGLDEQEKGLVGGQAGSQGVREVAAGEQQVQS